MRDDRAGVHDIHCLLRLRAGSFSRDRRRFPPLFAVVTLWSAITTVAAAQSPPSDTVVLSPVVVTATLVPTTAVTASTTVITGEQLEAQGFTHVGDALAALVPGAMVVRAGSFGGLTSLFLRGGESRYVRVMLDGVPLNDPGGGFDFASLTTAGVERIEVVRGPVSVLYGSDAVTGVIQIFTRRGSGTPRLSLNVSGGSYATASLGAGLVGGSAGASYGVQVSRYRTSGIYPFNNQYGDTKVSGVARLEVDRATDLAVALHYGDDVYHVPTEYDGAVVDRNAYQFSRRYALGVEAGRRLGPRAEAHVRLGVRSTDAGFDDESDGPADTLGFFADQSLQTVERRSADGRIDLTMAPATIATIGGLVEQERERRFQESLSEWGASGGRFDHGRHNAAGYVQLVGSAGPLDWNAGSRVDRNEAFGTFVTARGGLAARLPAAARLRASLGTAFREPSFFESFATGFVRGNPALRPERTTTWEIGMEKVWARPSARLAAVWFDQRFRDLIDFTFAPPGPDAPNYYNVAAARARGVELEARVETHGVRAQVQAAALETRVRDPGFDISAFGAFLADSALLRRPPHTATVNVGYSAPGRGALNVLIRMVGARADVDYAGGERVRLASYGTADLSAEYTLMRRQDRVVILRLALGNLTNRSYEPVVGYAAPGRTMLAGVAAEF